MNILIFQCIGERERETERNRERDRKYLYMYVYVCVFEWANDGTLTLAVYLGKWVFELGLKKIVYLKFMTAAKAWTPYSSRPPIVWI